MVSLLACTLLFRPARRGGNNFPLMSITSDTTESNSIEANNAAAVTLSNSSVELEHGPAGVVARIEYDDWRAVDYAGPLPSTTLEALLEVGEVNA